MNACQKEKKRLVIRLKSLARRIDRLIVDCDTESKPVSVSRDPGPCDQVCDIAVTMRELADDAQSAADSGQDIANSLQGVANTAASMADSAEQDCVDCLNQNS